MISFYYYGFLDYKGVIALKHSLMSIEKVNDPYLDTKSNENYIVVDSYLNKYCVDNYEEQYGPVCAASSVATMTNYFTNAGIDTNKVLEYFCKHYMGIIYDTCQFVNRNMKKLKQNYQRDLEAEQRITESEDKKKQDLCNNSQVEDNNLTEDNGEVDEDDTNDLIINFSAKEMNKKKTKKKLIKTKKKTKPAKPLVDEISESSYIPVQENSINDQEITNSCLFSCNQEIAKENATALEPSKSILDYPNLDPNTLFHSFLNLKISKTPLKDWYEENIPEQDFKIKGPIKSKIKKIRDNFRKLSKLSGTYGNCSTSPIGTSIWHNCMMHSCLSNKSDGMNFKAHKLIGTGGYRVEVNKKSFSDQSKLDMAWYELTHYLKYVRKEDKELYKNTLNKNNNDVNCSFDNANATLVYSKNENTNDESEYLKPSQILALHLANHYALIYGYRVVKLKDERIPEHLRTRRQVLCTRYGQRPKHWIDYDMTYYNDTDKKYKLSLAQTVCCFKTYNIVMIERVHLKNDKKKKTVFVNNENFVQHAENLDYVYSDYKDLTKEMNINKSIRSEEQEYLMIEKGNLKLLSNLNNIDYKDIEDHNEDKDDEQDDHDSESDG